MLRGGGRVAVTAQVRQIAGVTHLGECGFVSRLGLGDSAHGADGRGLVGGDPGSQQAGKS